MPTAILDKSNKIEEEESDVKLKKKYFIELVRLTSMQPEHLDPILPIMAQQALALSGVNGNIETITSIVKRRVLDEKFIEQFFPSFCDGFSLEELLQLISFYKSEAMKKFIKRGMKLYHPLYTAYRNIVKEIALETALKKPI